MAWLVTGGAGYIGSHIVSDLISAGHEVVIVDDLSSGLPSRVPPGVELLQVDVRDTNTLSAAIHRHAVSGIVHLAARKDVAESTADPLRYYAENLDGVRSVLRAAAETPARRLVYSSSAAVYGTPTSASVTEESATAPENAYGRTKLIGEWMLMDAAAAHGLQYVALRYFNVAGAGQPRLGDVGQTNLLPRLLHAAAEDTKAQVFGADYPTRDGSCVRDYVHVQDISAAHLRAIDALEAGELAADVFNVGGGSGVTVLEMIDAVRAITGTGLRHEIVERRPGDPASVVASPAKIHARLGWVAEYDLEAIVSSAWQAMQSPH